MGKMKVESPTLMFRISSHHKRRLAEIMEYRGIEVASEWLRRCIDDEYEKHVQGKSNPTGA